MNLSQVKLPGWYWLVTILLGLWYFMGVFNFFLQLTTTETALQAMPEEDRLFLSNYPWWVYIPFALSVFGGLIASALLLLRKKGAWLWFTISLLSVLVHLGASVSMALQLGIYLYPVIGMGVLLIVVGLFAIWLSRYSRIKGWVNG